MPPSEENFDRLMQDYARRRQSELDESCRFYQPPIYAVMGEVRKQFPSGPRSLWCRWVFFVKPSPAAPVWQTATIIATLVAGVLLATWAFRSTHPEQMLAFRAVPPWEELGISSTVPGSQSESAQFSAQVFSTGQQEAAARIGLPEDIELNTELTKVRFHSSSEDLKGSLTRFSTEAGAQTLRLRFEASGHLAAGVPATAQGMITLHARKNAGKIKVAQDVERILAEADIQPAATTNKLFTRRNYQLLPTNP